MIFTLEDFYLHFFPADNILNAVMVRKKVCVLAKHG